MRNPDPNYVDFGDIARTQLQQQCQYACRYLKHPLIGHGIRWKGELADYHFLTIHKDDVKTFVDRAKHYETDVGIRNHFPKS